MKATPSMMKHYIFKLLFSSFITLAKGQAVPPHNFGPQTAALWSTSPNAITAFQFSLLIPANLPWTHQTFALSFDPILGYFEDPEWTFTNEISYQNLSLTDGPAVVPPYYKLYFVTQEVNNAPSTTVANAVIYPSDTITVSFVRSGTGSTWNQQWSVVRGPTGTAAGSAASSGTHTFSFPVGTIFDYASLGVYFTDTFWDFGPITWSNIKITAATTDTSWCTTPVNQDEPVVSATYPNGLPVAKVSGSSSICSLQSMVWAQPPGTIAAENAYIAAIALCQKKQAMGLKCTY